MRGEGQRSQGDAWRGVASEDVDEPTKEVGTFLHRRSRRLLASLLAPHRARLIGALGLILLRTAAILAVPDLVGRAIDLGIKAHNPAQLGWYAGMIGVVAGVAAIGNWGFLTISGQVGQDVLYELRSRVYAHVQELSLAFYERYTSGRIISRLTNDIDTLTDLLATGLSSLLTSSFLVLTTAGILLALDLRLGAITLLALPAILLLTRWFQHGSARAYRAVRQAIALVIIHYTESLSGIRAVQAYGREPRNQAIFEDVNGRYRDANVWSTRLSSSYGPTISFIGRLAVVAVLVEGGALITHRALTLGVLTAFILYVRQLFEPMQDLAQFYNLFQAAAAAMEKLAGVLEERSTVPDPAHPRLLPRIAGRIEFDHVTFAYQERPVLHDVSFSIPAGQTVALVGKTGAGKTTIARLVARFYDPIAGSVRLDGIDLRELASDELRRAVVTVTQEHFLFSGSIADNIGFGRPGATRQEIEEAARVVGAHEFIAVLPEGYDTLVQRRGVRLSSGQRQLVVFARALLANPRVLILDEATSSLDLLSERLVQRALRALLAERTAIVIAHRLSTVAAADRVMVVEKGQIVEDGPPHVLASSDGHYGSLHRAWLASLA